jgi:NAD(P)-dependent dehydrogenase (short-subunit alcohol dehydrogenase family)
MEIRLAGKRALVTGGNSGIGKAITLALGEAGADVAVNYIVRPEDAESTAEAVRKSGPRALAVKADVSDPAQVEAMFSRVEEEWGGVDILVNNAGVDGKRALTWEIEVDDWRKVIEIDLLGPFHCARRALGPMVKRKSGVVLNMTSVHEVIPWEGYSAYAAAKAGLGMLTKTMAQEAAQHGVRVLALAPGAIKTAINRNVWDDEEGLKDLLTKIPLERMGETAEIARMAVVLCSEAASYLLGTTVVVDGGMTLYPSFEHGG